MSAAIRQAVAPAPAGPRASILEPDRNAVPLSAFLDQVAKLLRDGLPERLWVEATVIDVKASASGFTLELNDPALERGSATLRVFLPNAALVAIRRDLALALDPLLLVGLTTCLRITPHFSRRWHLGARVEALSRDAFASLKARLLERVIATLKRERLWDRQHAMPRPRDITRIAVIHPAGAAGWGDIAGELRRWERAGIVQVRSHPVPFEGERASAAIAAAFEVASLPLEGHSPDLVLIVRGGGARTSLAVLDDETIARAILACPVPVICGTGHAADQSLAGDVSWRHMDTPSKAIALVAEIIGAATRATAADWDAVLKDASTMMLTYAGQLELRQQAVTAAASHAIAAAGHHLAQLWCASKRGRSLSGRIVWTASSISISRLP